LSDSIDSISVIIPTYNGADKILNTLSALNNQTFLNFEVIIAIDGSTDDTEKVVSGFKYTFKNLSVFRQTNKGRSSIRNFGAKHAHGELLIFYDDDMRPKADSIERHSRFHQKYKDAICSGNQLEDYQVIKSDIQKYKAHLSRKWTSKYNTGLNKLNGCNLYLTAANMSILKYLFDKLGGFNESLTDAEDYEMAVKAISSGIDIYFDKSNIAWHDDFITCRKYILRQRQYDNANLILKASLPDTFVRGKKKMNLLKRMVYYYFSRSGIVKYIDQEKFWWLPKPLRYKLYSITIHSLSKIHSKVELRKSS